MINCPQCHRLVEGLFCRHCDAKPVRNPPIPPAAKAKIDAILAKHRRTRDREAELERAAIVEESAW